MIKNLFITVLLMTLFFSPNVFAKEVNFTILHTNDEHSAIISHSPVNDLENSIGGFARIYTVIEEIRESKNESVLLFNSGDFSGGTVFNWMALYNNSLELDLLQVMGYDAVAIGNHEYDYGVDILTNYLKLAGYPEKHNKTTILAGNIKVPDNHPLKSEGLYRKNRIIEIDEGIKIGIFNVMGEDSYLLINDTGVVEFTDEYRAAKEQVKELKERGSDVIVAITHTGVRGDKELAKKVSGIDVIVGGHCHTAIHEPLKIGKTTIVQAGYLGEYLGVLELAYNLKTKEVRVRNNESNTPYLIPINSQINPHPDISLIIDNYKNRLNDIIYEITNGLYGDIFDPVIASEFSVVDTPSLEETPAGNLITDAMRFSVEAISDEKVDIAFQADGNIRKAFIPSKGELSFYDVVEVLGTGKGLDDYPGYSLIKVYLTGKEVWRALELSVSIGDHIGEIFFLQLSGIRYKYNRDDSLFFNIPFINKPIVLSKTIKNLELYTGKGPQTDNSNDYTSIKKDNTLYSIVIDSHMFSFLSILMEEFPQINIFPKKANGEIVSNPVEMAISYNNRDLKAWDSVLMYLSSQYKQGLNPYYKNISGRITKSDTFPYIGWVVIILLTILTIIMSIMVFGKK